MSRHHGSTANEDQVQDKPPKPHTKEPVSIRVALLYLLPVANG